MATSDDEGNTALCRLLASFREVVVIFPGRRLARKERERMDKKLFARSKRHKRKAKKDLELVEKEKQGSRWRAGRRRVWATKSLVTIETAGGSLCTKSE